MVHDTLDQTYDWDKMTKWQKQLYTLFKISYLIVLYFVELHIHWSSILMALVYIYKFEILSLETLWSTI